MVIWSKILFVMHSNSELCCLYIIYIYNNNNNNHNTIGQSTFHLSRTVRDGINTMWPCNIFFFKNKDPSASEVLPCDWEYELYYNEIFKAVNFLLVFFSLVTPCAVIGEHQDLGGIYRLRLSCRGRRYCSPKILANLPEYMMSYHTRTQLGVSIIIKADVFLSVSIFITWN
jgi:hypothetical protein